MSTSSKIRLDRIVRASLLRKQAFDWDNPIDLFDRMMEILKGLMNTVHLERERPSIVDAWEQRSTEVNWDWRPVAKFVSDWLTTHWRSPNNVWMTKYPGRPITIYFQDRGDINKRWESKHEAKWRTLKKQLERRFGMKEIGFESSVFLLPDGKTKVKLDKLFFGGTPSSERL